MDNHNYCIIMAGGIGARFWPVSTESKPKQFQKIHGLDKSFLQNTYARMSRTIPQENIFVATMAKYRDLVLEQIPGMDESRLIIEPYRRNTAATITYAAFILREKDPDAVMIATPSDHSIGELELFDRTILEGLDYASRNDVLLTLGIVPTRPDTNYGYVQVTGGSRAYSAGVPVQAKTFTEKPDIEIARVFVESGEFLWNSGIFIWKADTVLRELQRFCPEYYLLWKGWEEASVSPGRESFIERAYSDSPMLSIDYALMEKSDKVWVLPAKFPWGDVGSWSTMYQYASAGDGNGNALKTAGPTIAKDVEGTMVYTTDSGKLTVLSGLKDFLVVDTDKALLICPRDDKKFQEIASEIA